MTRKQRWVLLLALAGTEPLPGHNKRLAAKLWLATEADGGTRVWAEAADAP
ncbi:hypothetical protein ACWGKU_13570 [Kitasatospora sp. NPDC054768]